MQFSSKEQQLILLGTSLRKDFPILTLKNANNQNLVYFDNAATTQKPKTVIDSITNYYTTQNANIHRGAHQLADEATQLYEACRTSISNFIGAKNPYEIIFTKGTTESINTAAFSFSKKYIQVGDEIILSALEHHANFVPWQMIAKQTGAKLKFIPLNKDTQQWDLDKAKSLFTERTKLVAVSHVSNAIGVINPIESIIKYAKSVDATIMIDGAQAISHIPVNVQALDVDFYAFSAHKLYGPTGVGVLYGKEKWLNELPPVQFGGEMIDKVTFENVTFNTLPHKFESGTPNIAGVIAFHESIKYIEKTGLNTLYEIETFLQKYLYNALSDIEGIKVLGHTNDCQTAILSFNVDGVEAYDIGTLLNQYFVAIRVGSHCAQPLMQHLNISGTVRASLSFYNTTEEIDFFSEKLRKVLKMLL